MGDSIMKIKKRKKFIPNYEIPGVYKVVLDEDTQLNIGVTVGKYVTAENPWILVKTELIIDSLEHDGDNSKFAPLIEPLGAYEEPEILLGYILDDSTDDDQFYICLTADAMNQCWEQKEKFLRRQKTKLEKSIYKTIRPWTSLGSEQELDDLIPSNSRPLIEVEFNSRFPTAIQPEYFSIRDIGDVRDGYLQFTPYRETYQNVKRIRIDTAVQAAPLKTESEAQTVLRYPKNVWTQSMFSSGPGMEVQDDDTISDITTSAVSDVMIIEEQEVGGGDGIRTMPKAPPTVPRTIDEFLKEKYNRMSNYVKFNAAIDIYRNDYKDIARPMVDACGYEDLGFHEYMQLTHICTNGKRVSSVAWHRTWAGIVAIAYADIARSTVKKRKPTGDIVQRDVFGINPVLIWSHLDSLRPRLFLDAYREVKCLSFCPWDENILIGGCINGQIIIWDLKNKMEGVEDCVVLNEAQVCYKMAMNSHMGWMKNIHSKSMVRPVAVSDLLYNHICPVTEITWISPNYEVTRTGQVKLLPKDSPRSFIFMTCSEDGNILLWYASADVLNLIDSKFIKKSKRITKWPAGLLEEQSSFEIFDRVLQPIFKLLVNTPNSRFAMPMQSMTMNRPPIKYVSRATKSKKGRKYFDVVLGNEVDSYDSHSCIVGSSTGHVAHLNWEGHTFNTGEKINAQAATFLSELNLHDGPVVACATNPFHEDIVLTVGGKIFALWCMPLVNQPLMWKRRKYRLTDVTWSQHKPSVLFLSNSQGSVEVWDLLQRSDVPIHVQNISGQALSGLFTQKLKLVKQMLGVAEHKGTFRIFLLPDALVAEFPGDIGYFTELIDRELCLKECFIKWQDNWKKVNWEVIAKRKAEENAVNAATEEEEKAKLEKEKLEKEAADEVIRQEKRKTVGPEERWRLLMLKMIERTISAKKQLNKEELMRQEAPLKELENQRGEKLRKQMEVLKNQKAIFEETVAILFPEAAPKPPKADKSMPVVERERLKAQYSQDYKKVSAAALDTIKRNPFTYKFDWMSSVNEGQERRRSLDKNGFYATMHKQRLLKKKEEKPSRISEITEESEDEHNFSI